MKREELEKIVKQDLPGHRLASTAEPTDNVETHKNPESSTPEIDAILDRVDWGNDGGAANGPVKAGLIAGDESLDDSIALVVPEAPADSLARKNRPKAQVFSARKKTIIGSQG